MDFFAFHLMPWPHLPDDYEKKLNSAWVWAPNEFYDPEKGHHLYNPYLDELECKAWANLVPGSKLVTIPECGHLPPIEQPADFFKETLAFLKG